MTDRHTHLDTAAVAEVVGFAPDSRRWVTAADTVSGTPSAQLPALDGDLVFDLESRRAASTDLGNLVHREPAAVLRPRSADDISAMVWFCRTHRIPVSVRGQAHTTHGQGLCGGLVIENRQLDRIHVLGPDHAEVDAGITWKELATAAFDRKLTPPVLTGYTGLTVGGTLSVGGIGGLVGGLRTGLQVDHVLELEVVTGTGDVVRCSRTRRSDLFEAVLGGLGRSGVITRAVIELVPAKERAHTWTLEYGQNAPFFQDLRTMIERPGVDHVYGEMFVSDAGPLYLLHATAFYDSPAELDDRKVTDGLATEPSAVDSGYLAYAFSIDDAIDELRDMVSWDRLVKPWFDVWLPGTAAEACVGEIMGMLTPADIGQYGAGLIYPQRRELTTTPSPRLPAQDGSPWAYVLDVNTVSDTTDPGPFFAEAMLDRNRRMFARARDAHGATLYPIGSIPFTEQDWRDHYGDTWSDLCAAKRRYDPDGVLPSGARLPD